MAEVSLDDMPAPDPIEKVSPDRVVADILIARLRQVQRNAKPEIVEAAGRFLSALREKVA